MALRGKLGRTHLDMKSAACQSSDALAANLKNILLTEHLRLGDGVDHTEIKIGELYSVLMLDGCVHGINGAAAAFNGIGLGKDGGYADYVTVPAHLLVKVVRSFSPIYQLGNRNSPSHP